MNYTGLIQKLSAKYHLRQSFSKKLLNTIIAEISQELITGQRVNLRQFGSFTPLTRPPRKYYDPKTKKVKTKPAHKTLTFRPSQQLLKQLVTKPNKTEKISA